MDQNALLPPPLDPVQPAATNSLLPDPYAVNTADAYRTTTNALGGWLDAQRAKSAAMGLWNDTTGLPTQNGMLDAAHQYAGALVAGTSAPETRGATMDNPAFSKWFSESKVVDEAGQPLVVYHGTNRDVRQFVPHSSQPVYYADGLEIPRADSWNMGDTRTNMPEGYHYGALGDAVQLGPEEALRMRTKEAAPYPSGPDTQRLLSDLQRLQGRAVTMRYEQRPTGAGSYFTPDKNYSYISRAGDLGEGANVMPVHLSIQNPVYLNSAAIESAGHDFSLEKYKAQGYDGAIFAPDPMNLSKGGWPGSTQIVAFDPTQIKSAIGNRGTFDPKDPRITAGIAGLIAGGAAAATQSPPQQ